MRQVQPSTGRLDIDGRVITAGASIIICCGYSHKTRRYDCLKSVKAKHVIVGPFTVTVTYTGKPLKSEKKRADGKIHLNRTRKLVRLYKVSIVQLNVGKIGLVLGRNKFIQSNWDVVIDGIVYAVSSKFIKLLDTTEDIALVQSEIKNKPVTTSTS